MSQRHIVHCPYRDWPLTSPFKKLKGRQGQVTTHTQQQDPGSGCFFDGNNKTWEQNPVAAAEVASASSPPPPCLLQYAAVTPAGNCFLLLQRCSHWDMVLWAEGLTICRGGVLLTWIRQAIITKDILILRHMYRCKHSLRNMILIAYFCLFIPQFAVSAQSTSVLCTNDTQFPWQCSPAECCRSAEPVPAQGAAANFLQSHRRGAPAVCCIILQFRE